MGDARKLPAGFTQDGKVERPVISKWSSVGETFTGFFLRLEDSRKFKNTKLAVCLDEEGALVNVPAPIVLAQMLSTLPEKTPVHIIYTGDAKTPNGTMKEFELYRGDI